MMSESFDLSLQTILSTHKCHLNTVLLDPKQERENPWFMNKESSEIMNACFNLEVQELHSSSSVALSGDAATSLDDIAAHILQINRFLYGPNFVKHLVYTSLPLNLYLLAFTSLKRSIQRGIAKHPRTG